MNLRMYFFIVFWHFCSDLFLLGVRQLAITVLTKITKILPNRFFIFRRPMRFGFIVLDFNRSLIDVPIDFGVWCIFFLSVAFKDDERDLPFEKSTNLKVLPPWEIPIVCASGSWKMLLKQKVKYKYYHETYFSQSYMYDEHLTNNELTWTVLPPIGEITKRWKIINKINSIIMPNILIYICFKIFLKYEIIRWPSHNKK